MFLEAVNDMFIYQLVYIFGPQEIDVVKFWIWHPDHLHFALQLAGQLHNVL
jgi:hypothetical protein